MICNKAVLQNLTDAGCDAALIEAYRKLSETSACEAEITQEQTRLLCEYRRDLLNRLHEDQRRIDCLDYLLFQLREQGKGR